MGYKAFYRARLPEYVDLHGDLAPPWERFPSYERCTIGWRMGSGESWLYLWEVFLETLGQEYDARLAYLRRHPPAPVSWADRVYLVLHPNEPDTDRGQNDYLLAERRAALLAAGLIASDAAYTIWLSQQDGVRWPWEFAETPELAARYWTRVFWFWSRQVNGLRVTGGLNLPPAPEQWMECGVSLATGRVDTPDPLRGLLTLARMFSAGHITPPWQMGLTVANFADSFADNMGFVDAFRLWGMSAFDDREHLPLQRG